jgi:hypothetical protein
MRFLWQSPLQQACSPQNSCVSGPQSANVTQTSLPEHLQWTFTTCPQPRRGRLSPHAPGLVTLKHAALRLGQAPMCLPDWQVPHAPVPADPQGPQALPQQNQLVSPRANHVDEHATGISFRSDQMTGRAGLAGHVGEKLIADSAGAV